jgi:sulfatase modifying factor 1
MLIWRKPVTDASKAVAVEGSKSPAPRTQLNPKDGLTYVWVPPGAFAMGCSSGDSGCAADERPTHQVTVAKGFWIGQTEVTQTAFERVGGTNPSYFRGPLLPVTNIDLNQAQDYCQAVGMRLPTEAEWEYAARGGNSAAGYGTLDAIAWMSDNSGGNTHPVAQKRSNGFGLYDVLGNVWEFVSDWYDRGYYGSSPSLDPHGPVIGSYRVVRGGSVLDRAGILRVSVRGRYEPGYRTTNYGFRCGGESTTQVSTGPHPPPPPPPSQEPTDVVRKAIIKDISTQKRVAGMAATITDVVFRQDEADATVHLQPKTPNAPGARVEMRYVLTRRGNEWVVKDRSIVRGTSSRAAMPAQPTPQVQRQASQLLLRSA